MRRILAAGLALSVTAGLMAMVATAASARSICDAPIPPLSCDGPVEPPPPPVGSDAYPVAVLESWQYVGGAVRVTGWASDANGGPVQMSVFADAPFAGVRPANLWHPGRGAYVGFDITVPSSAVPGTHNFCVQPNNVANGTLPVPDVAAISCPQYHVQPAAPTGLVLTSGYAAGKRWLDVTFTDNSTTESRYLIDLSWLSTTPDDTPTDPGLPTNPPGGPALPIPQPTWGAPIPTTEVGVARAQIYGTAGTGTRTWHFTDMPAAYVYAVITSTDGGLTSAALTGGVSTR